MARVLYYCAIAGIGGAERSLLDLLGRLPRERVTPVLLVPSHGALSCEAAKLGVITEVMAWPGGLGSLGRERHLVNRLRLLVAPFQMVPLVVRLARRIRALRIDLVHTNGTKANVIGSLAALLARRPVVWHIRDVIQPGLLRTFLRGLGSVAPCRIIANSKASAAAFTGSRAARRTVVVYNGVEASAFTTAGPSALRAELGLGPEALVITTVGALAPLKGHIHLLRAMPRVLQELPGSRLLILGGEMYETAGHAGYAASLRAEAARLGIDGHVIFAGWRPDAAAFYNASDVVVLASIRPESFGRVLIEAMASSRPVIATDLGGPREIITSSDLGLLVPPADPEALAQAILTLGRDRSLRQRLGAAGRSHVEKRFDLGRHVEEVMSVYGQALVPEAPQPALVA